MTELCQNVKNLRNGIRIASVFLRSPLPESTGTGPEMTKYNVKIIKP